MDQVMIEKMNNLEKEIDEGLKELVTKYRKRKIMAKTKETPKEGYQPKDKLDKSKPPKREKSYKLTEGEIQKIQTDFKDLKDLYKNETKVRQELAKENLELKANIQIKDELLRNVNDELKDEIQELNEKEFEHEKEMAIGETQVEEMENQITMLREIIDKLIDA